ncbi:hypothetical protein AB0L13_44915 [Saccharopolyspora shandongensis]|uniref:hypothetical protein n=1 Tax=Saccharopolyspora shandongensis TaxID=418495 RepID=UPI00344AA079
MRKINRALAAGALSLPLALGIAGVASAEGQDANIRVESQASAQVHGRGSAEASSHASVEVNHRDGRGDHRWDDGRWNYRWNHGRWGFYQVRGHYHPHQDKLRFLDHGLIGHDLRIVR